MFDFLSNYSEALFGLLGVIIGGFITFFSERYYRKKDKFAQDRINYMLSVNELSKVYSDQYVLLKSLTSRLPTQKPEILINNVMPTFSNSMKPVSFDIERLITLAVKRKTYFSDIQLAFDRFNGVLQLFSNYQNARKNLDQYKNIEALHLNNNSASVAFNPRDPNFVISFLTAENLLRTLISHLNENIKDCRKLLTEVSSFGDKIYKTKYEQLIEPKFPSYIENLNELNVGDLPPFKTSNEKES